MRIQTSAGMQKNHTVTVCTCTHVQYVNIRPNECWSCPWLFNYSNNWHKTFHWAYKKTVHFNRLVNRNNYKQKLAVLSHPETQSSRLVWLQRLSAKSNTKNCSDFSGGSVCTSHNKTNYHFRLKSTGVSLAADNKILKISISSLSVLILACFQQEVLIN